jgi:hypothetical protein
MSVRRCSPVVLLLACLAPLAQADFGNYTGHEVIDHTVVVQTDIGELRVTALNDAAFEVHYIERSIKQLPSFAIADAA